MTRIANEKNEDYLLMIAYHGTAHHVEKLVSLYSRCKRLQDTQTANEQHGARERHRLTLSPPNAPTHWPKSRRLT